MVLNARTLNHFIKISQLLVDVTYYCEGNLVPGSMAIFQRS